ncbi:restriction endonuclease subunit S [uncultured Eubacterium sp.]|uniref:restriction endonuclease subunit S n=1 Tax=uncultured Eubacterium sp. TaxID=165185 RepID=UPI003267F2DB
MKNDKKPQVRFKGFNDDWEQRKFEDVVQIERGGSPRPIDDYITDSPNGLNWVKIGDAPAQGHYITKTAEKIRPEGLSKTREVHPGDLILSNSMSFGKPYIIGIDGCIHDGWLFIRDTNNTFDLTFLCHLLGTPQMLDQYRSLAAGSTVNNLNKELVGNTVVTIPKIDEQRVLGQYLERLDNLITLHQRKCDKLQKIKKSMLEKMFPQNGMKKPEIRFKGFNDDWEQRKFGDVGSVAMCKRIFKEQTSDEGEISFYKIGTFGGEPDAFISRELFDEYKNKYPYPNKGDILISASGSIGRTIEFTGKDEYFQDSNIVWLKHKNEIDNRFLKVLYAVVEWSCEGSTIKRLYNDNFLKKEFMLPQINEQIKLGKYFKQLDHLITLHQRKLEKLKYIKKSMLENMFV